MQTRSSDEKASQKSQLEFATEMISAGGLASGLRSTIRLHTFQVFFINADVHSYNTRFATNYHITVHRTSLLHYTIRIAGPLLWNSLDSNIKSVTS